VQIRFEITPSDHLEMLRERIGFSARPIRTLLGVAGTLLGLFAYYFHLLGDLWIVVMAAFGGLTIAELFLPNIAHQRIYYRNPILFEARTVTITEEGIRSEKASGSVEVKWSSFEKFKETKHLFLTYQGKDVVGIVPKRAFPKPEGIAQFRNLLASKIPGQGIVSHRQ
jgi:YcxB-like protein